MPVLHFQEVQALDRTQPGLPIIKGRAGTMTHDDKRMAPLPCLLRSMSRATAISSSCASCGPSTSRRLKANDFLGVISCWTNFSKSCGRGKTC